MNPRRKTQIIFALLVSNVFLFQSCATIIRGTSQKIPVTSNPIGAKIIVDGEEIGYAPLELKLKRKKKIQIIRIEKQGYNPLDVIITGKISKSFLENPFLWANSILAVCIGGSIAYEKMKNKYWELPEGIAKGLISVLLWSTLVNCVISAPDFLTGAYFTLSPKELNVTLTKIEENLQCNFILIDAEQFQNIKWIRIKCTDNDKEEIVNID